MPARRNPLNSLAGRFGYGGPTTSLPFASSSAYTSVGHISDLVGRARLATVGPITPPPPPRIVASPPREPQPVVWHTPARGERLETPFYR